MTMHTIIIKYNIGVKTACAVVVHSVQLARTLLDRFYLARYSAAQGQGAENDNTRRVGQVHVADAGDGGR